MATEKGATGQPCLPHPQLQAWSVAGPPATVPLPSLVAPAPRWVLSFGPPTRRAQKRDKSMGRGSVPSGRESPGHLDRCPTPFPLLQRRCTSEQGRAPLPAQLPAHLQQPRTQSRIQTRSTCR